LDEEKEKRGSSSKEEIEFQGDKLANEKKGTHFG
jgi:hypothetical protein